MDMVSVCLKTQQPFGVCQIRKGREVGMAAEPERVGTLAFIDHCDISTPGILTINAHGGARFEIIQTYNQKNNLVVADIHVWPTEPPLAVPDTHQDMVSFLQQVIAQLDVKLIPPPHHFNDASWVGMRLAHILPLAPDIKQALLEQRDPLARLRLIKAALVELTAKKPDG